MKKIYESIVEEIKKHHQLDYVWCKTCGTRENINASICFEYGWPKCCGYTMTIDPPETWER